MSNDIQFGDLIPIADEKRPEWLTDDDTPVWWTDKPAGIDEHISTAGRLVWKQGRYPLTAIRLPADHPHYHPAPVPVPAVDWTKPIEAVHEEGRVVAVERSGGSSVAPTLEGGWYTFQKTGKHSFGHCRGASAT